MPRWPEHLHLHTTWSPARSPPSRHGRKGSQTNARALSGKHSPQHVLLLNILPFAHPVSPAVLFCKQQHCDTSPRHKLPVFQMACKKDNCHTIHRYSFFAGPWPFQMQADRLSISLSYRYITIAISISVDEIGYLFPCLVYTHVFEARNECSRTIIPFHPAYIKAYESHIPS